MFFIGSPQRWQPLRKLGLAFALAVAALVAPVVSAKESPAAPVALNQLPAEARATHELIRSGGPFPYTKDGTVFGNRERLLPRQQRGYYREYTVRTPGTGHRGARRIVCGGSAPTQPDACFYTSDHYASFRRIVQ